MSTFRTLAVATFAVVSSALAPSAFSQERAPNHCRAFTSPETCRVDVGCSWKEAETWTRATDGRERTTRARCAYDARAARAILSGMATKPAQ